MVYVGAHGGVVYVVTESEQSSIILKMTILSCISQLHHNHLKMKFLNTKNELKDFITVNSQYVSRHGNYR